MQELTPGIFSVDGSGAGYGFVVHADTVNLTAADVGGAPARAGDVVSIFATGLGGSSGPAPVVLIDGLAAEVVATELAGEGVHQIDVRIPEGVSVGDLIGIRVQMPAITGRMITSKQVSIAVIR